MGNSFGDQFEDDGEAFELPTLSLRSMEEGDFIVVTFDKEYTEKQLDGDSPAKITTVLDHSDGIKKSMVVPYVVFKHWEEIKGRMVKITRGAIKGRCRMYDIRPVKLKGEKKGKK